MARSKATVERPGARRSLFARKKLEASTDEAGREWKNPWMSDGLWGVSALFGKSACCVVVGVAAILLIRNHAGVRAGLSELVPRSVASWFERGGDPVDPGVLEDARAKVLEGIRAAGNRTNAGRRPFRVGSTESDVLAAQGKPTRKGDGVWEYGGSRVYFSEGRVVGWNSAPENPLSAR